MHLPLPARVLSKLVQVIGYVSSNRDDIFAIAAGQILEMFDVDACIFSVSEDNGLRIVGTKSKDPSIARELLHKTIDRNCPAFADGLMMCVGDSAKDHGCSEGLICSWARSYLCLPLTVRGERMGVMTVASRSAHSFTPEEIDLYLAVASLVAISVQNAELYATSEKQAAEIRRLVDNKTEALRALNRVTDGINSANSVDQAIEALSGQIHKIVPCDVATIALLGERNTLTIVPVRGDHRGGEAGTIMRMADTVLADLAVTGKARVQAGSPPPRAARLVGADATSYAIAPLIAAGRVLGSLNVARSGEPKLSHADLPNLTQVAGQMAAALERIELYEHERTISRRFQETLQPAGSYSRLWLSLASRYEAALDEADVGGDFCDIIEIDDHRIAVAVGDISGKGLAAALRAAETKYMLQAYALEDPSPATVLRRLNNAVSVTFNEEFATLFYGIVDLSDATLTYANAGHELPVRFRSGVPMDPLDVTGPALAISGNGVYDARVVSIEPADLILCYTDGITEARCGTGLWGYEGLINAMLQCPSLQPRTVVDHVYCKAREFANNHLADDVALLAISHTGVG